MTSQIETVALALVVAFDCLKTLTATRQMTEDSKTAIDESHGMEDRRRPEDVQDPPRDTWGIIRRLGPGLIVAGSIVGSGELIATTVTGAQAGFWLLWLIIIGCVIKVFVQIEFGRYAITSGRTTMAALAEVPGPRLARRGNWLIWYWFLMFLASIAQLGGIVGAVGQALSISAPVTQYGSAYNQFAEAETQLIVVRSQIRIEAELENGAANIPFDEIADQRLTELIRLERESSKARLALFRAQAKSGEQEWDEWIQIHQSILDESESIIDGGNSFQLAQYYWYAYELCVELEPQRESLEKKIAEQSEPDEELQSELQSLLDKIESTIDRIDSIALSNPDGGFQSNHLESRRLDKPNAPIDDKIWAGLVAIMTAVLLVVGRFGLIQSFSTVMVASFTAITIVNLFLLQSQPTWSVSFADIKAGLSFRLPPSEGGETTRALATALQTFGIIGVGASELIVYPYWCLEKGYGRYTGKHESTAEWAERANGWLKVMRWDAWGSMFVYTFATVAFYLLGAATLGRTGLLPAGSETVRYLSVMYEPVFGSIATMLFLFGAFAVLYSTYFVANASHARVFSDAVRVMGLAKTDEDSYRKRVRLLSGIFPLLCFIIFVFIPAPTQLVLLSGLMQAMMLPMLAAAALYFRYRRIDSRLHPNLIWDGFLWLSAIGMLIAGFWAGWTKFGDIFAALF